MEIIINCCVYPAAPVVCNNPGSLARGQKNIMTVVGEDIKLQCFFKGNLNILDLSLFVSWEISYRHGQKTKRITDNSTYPYHLAHFQTCLTDDGSCCEFVDQLTFIVSSGMVGDVNLACIAAIDKNSTASYSNISKSISLMGRNCCNKIDMLNNTIDSQLLLIYLCF